MSARALAAAYAVGLIPALVIAIGQPVWSRVDEAAHYDVIAQYAAGVYPRDSVTTIRPETFEIMEKTGVYGFVVDNAYQRPAGLADMPSGLTDAQHVLWIRRHGWQYSYEAFQPPLYYAAALPAWKIGDALGGPFGALYGVRVFDALLAALLAPLAMLIAFRLWPAVPEVGWGAAVLTVVLPGVDANLTSVTNDVMVAVLGGASIAVALGGPATLRRALMVGALLGAAVLAKTTAVALVPAIVVAFVLRRRGGGVVPAAAAVATAALIVLPWVISNVMIYGEVLTSKEQLAMSAFPQRTAALDFWSVSTLHSFVTFWSGDPFLSLPLAVPLALLAVVLCALAVAGLFRMPRTDALLIVALAGLGAATASVASPILAAFNAPGRLAYVGLAALTALVAVGLWRELRSARLRAAFIGGFAALALVGLAISIVPPESLTGPGQPGIASRVPLGSTASLGDFNVVLNACEVDPTQNVWLDVTIVIKGPSAVDWSQTVEVLAAGRVLATSAYSRGSELAMTLPGGDNENAYLWLGPRSRLAGADAVVFRNVAVDDYHSVGDLAIPTPLC